MTGFLIKVKGRGIFDKGDTTLGEEEGNTAMGKQLGGKVERISPCSQRQNVVGRYLKGENYYKKAPKC